MPLIQIKEGLDIHYQLLNPKGEETITIIHGMFGNLSQFYLSIGPELAKQYTVLVFDLKSHGKSSKYPTGYGEDELAKDMVLLWDALQIEKSHILGFSFGAILALKTGINYPNRVGEIIAMELPPLPKDPIKGQGTYSWNEFIYFVHTLPAHIRENFLSSKRRLHKMFTMYEYILNETTFVPDTNARVPLAEADLAKLTEKCLFLFGNTSVCIPELERIQDWIKNHYVYIFEGKHDFFINQSLQVAQLIQQFLSTTDFDTSGSIAIIRNEQ